MFRNYFKTAVRSISRGKWYSVINIFSLVIGMSVSVLAYLFISYELSFNQFNDEYDNLYRLTNIESLNGQEIYRDGVMYPMKDVLKNELSSIEKVARIAHRADYQGLPLISYGDKQFLEKQYYWADKELFDLFSFPFIEGDERTALNELRSIVLSKAAAQKYFGTEPALGKEVKVKADFNININGRQAEDYVMVVSAVVEIPEKSSVQFEVAANILFSNLENRNPPNWYSARTTTYIQLSNNSDPSVLRQQFPAFIQKYVDRDIKDRIAFGLQPLSNVHLGSLPGDPSISDNKQTINLLAIIAVSILILACINFTNLSTARFTRRAREVGIRKVVGAIKGQLIFQFLIESILLSFFATIGAIVLVFLLVPVFNQLVDSSLTIDLTSRGLWFSLLSLTMIVGGVAGIYPAFFLSSFKAISVLKGHFTNGFKGTMIRKFLVVSQFTATIILLIGVTVVSLQINFIENANLDINKDQYAMMRLKEGVYTQQDRYIAFKNELTNDASVLDAAGTWSAPFGVNVPVFNYPFKTEVLNGEERVRMHLIRADEDFIDAFDIEVFKGRKLSLEFSNDVTSAFVVNESAAKLLGFDDPVGHDLDVYSNGGGSPFKQGKIVGLMKDFNFLSLHKEISPLVISMSTANRYRYMVVRFNPMSTTAMLKHVTATWDKFEPGWPIELFFMDEEWKMHYESETRLGKIVQYLTFIAILIACLGLFALSGFSFEKRKREMSIRKVLGASLHSIYQLLSVDFVKLVFISFVLATPIGWKLSANWLNGFAYRIDLSWWIFGFVGLGMLVLTMLTISYHSSKSAKLNPVDNLKAQ